jgi:hypothetical protein
VQTGVANDDVGIHFSPNRRGSPRCFTFILQPWWANGGLEKPIGRNWLERGKPVALKQ